MPIKRLTQEGVNKLKPPPKGKQVDYFDAGMPGLVLRVNYGGAKVWRALYYLKRLDKNGNKLTIPTTHKLGRYPVLGVKEAREAARRFLANPQKALADADAGSFEVEAEKFMRMHVQANKLRWQAEIERCLAKYVYPAWQHRKFRDIKRGDVTALLDGIQERHGARQADVVLAIVRKIMRWYQSREDDYICPVVPGMQRSNGHDRKRKRILDDDEIRLLFKAAADCGTFGALVKTLLLTAQRKDKVASMRWEDVVDGEWRIASEAREKGNAGSLRLPQLVLDIIAAQPRIAGNPYVFAGRGGSAFNSFSQRKHELEAQLKIQPWVIHDLRRTARSLMSRAGVNDHHAERCLGHVIGGVKGVYDRHDYQPEMKHAYDELAALIERIANPPEGNVTTMRKKKRA